MSDSAGIAAAAAAIDESVCVCRGVVGACWLGNHSEQTKERFTTLCDTTCVVGSGLLASVHRTTSPNLENPYEGQDVFQSGHGRQQELHRMPRLFTVEKMVRKIARPSKLGQSWGPLKAKTCQSRHGRSQELHRVPRLFAVKEMAGKGVQDHAGDRS